MSKTKKSEVPHYEMLYIISNQFSEDEVKPINEKIHKAIKDNGGEVTYQEEWGKKKLCYPIKNFGFGYYFLVEFDMPGNNLINMDKNFRMSNEILRHQIVRKVKKSAEEIKAEKEQAEKKIVEQKFAEEKEEEKKEEIAKKEAKKMDLKDLDEKLDKILDTDDLL